MIRRIIFVCLALICVSGPAFGQEGAVLQISPDLRATGMGMAEAVLSTSPFAAWGNPAGLGFADGIQVSFSAEEPSPLDFIENDMHWYGSASASLGSRAVPLTVNLNYNHLVYDWPWEGSRNRDRQIARGGALAFRFLPTLSAGVGLKFYDRDCEFCQSETSGHAFDFGLLFSYDATPIQVGVALNNIGPDVTVKSGFEGATPEWKSTLPETFRASVGTGFDHGGTASFLLKNETVPLISLAASIGGEKLLSGDIPDSVVSRLPYLVRHEVILYGGLEVKTLEFLAARVGYVHDEGGHIKDFTWGLGLSFLKYGGVDFSSRPLCCDFARRSRFGGWVAVPF